MILHGDCLEILRGMEDASVDAVVTDPPYGLSDHSQKDVAACIRAWLKGETFRPDKVGLLGNSWDAWVPGPEVWREVRRVLKPGGHALVFAGTRTMDLMALAMRLGGLELRDSIGWCHDSGGAPLMAWVYNSGFPKGIDVAKAIDKARVEDIEPMRRVCRYLRAAMDAKGLKSRMMVQHFEGCHPRLIDHWAARDTDSQPAVPTWVQWLKLKEVLDLDAEMDPEVWRLNERKGQPGDTWVNAEVVGTYASMPGALVGAQFKRRDDLIRKASETAEEWSGWNTALKPAWEPIIVARKPLDGTVAQNVMAHGVGGLNVDGCRVAYEETQNAATNPLYRVQNGYATKVGSDAAGSSFSVKKNGGEITANSLGRWPANVVHDDSGAVRGAFDTFGERKTGYIAAHHKNRRDSEHLNDLGHPGEQGYNDSGSALRYFYAAKPDGRWPANVVHDGSAVVEATFAAHGESKSSDKARNNKGATKSVAKGHDKPHVGFGHDDEGTASRFFVCAKADKEDRAGSRHPTVKPVDLMRWLCRLVTPKDGVVLDPFAGSGTTGEAAVLEGFRPVLIEREEEYAADIRRRMEGLSR